jgi:hypothetical protein
MNKMDDRLVMRQVRPKQQSIHYAFQWLGDFAEWQQLLASPFQLNWYLHGEGHNIDLVVFDAEGKEHPVAIKWWLIASVLVPGGPEYPHIKILTDQEYEQKYEVVK